MQWSLLLRKSLYGRCRTVMTERMTDRPRILVVDDDLSQLELMHRLLSGEGFEVATTPMPIGVSNLVKEFAPDVVLLDVNIPALPGNKLMALARRHARPGTRFVLYSGCEESELRLLAVQAQADDWIPKRAAPSELVVRLRALCAHARQLAQSTS